MDVESGYAPKHKESANFLDQFFKEFGLRSTT